MAESQTSSPAAQPAKAQSNAERPLDKTIEGERRSFDNGTEVARKAAQTTSEATRDIARAGVEANRQITESGRRAGQEIAEHWRSSLQPLTAVQMEMNRWFDELWHFTTGFSAFPTLRNSHPFMGAMGAAPLFGLPAADVKEAKDAYTLAIELPGLTRHDIDLWIQDGNVVISGHKAEEKEDATAAFRISERRFGRFERSFPLPSDADPARIHASYQDGVLKVAMPKHAGAADRRSKIEIKG